MKALPVIATLFCLQPAFADITAGELLEECDKSDLVMERVDGDAKIVGEELNSYCKGYIEGHLAALRGKVCMKGRDTHFALSLFKRYVNETPSAAKQPAGDVLSKALLRAYACK
jgi:hypothetical protein